MDLAFSNLSAFSNQVWLLAFVIVLKWLITRFTSLNSFQFFRFYCQQLALKVNKTENSNNQRIIAGGLSLAITLTTLVVMLWLFEDFIEVLWLWQGLLLFFALDGFHLGRTGKSFAKALVANNKYQAKQLIQPLVLRDCEQLSIMGLSKAFLEMHILKVHQQLLVSSFLFLISGPLTAFSYRLLLEMHYSWNPKRSHFVEFGKVVTFIVNILQWLPGRILTLCLLLLALNSQTILFWRLIKADFFKLNNDILLNCFALVNGVKLAGVAIYNNENQLGEKLRRRAFNEQARQPQASDIIHANQKIVTLLIFISTALIGFGVISYLLGN